MSKRIGLGACPYTGNGLFSPPPFGLELQFLPPALQTLFQRWYGPGHSHPEARPTAREWADGLGMAQGQLATCATNGQHVYGQHLQVCPWCERMQRTRVDEFPPLGSVAPPPPATAAPQNGVATPRGKARPPLPTPPTPGPARGRSAGALVGSWLLLMVGSLLLWLLAVQSDGQSPMAGLRTFISFQDVVIFTAIVLCMRLFGLLGGLGLALVFGGARFILHGSGYPAPSGGLLVMDVVHCLSPLIAARITSCYGTLAPSVRSLVGFALLQAAFGAAQIVAFFKLAWPLWIVWFGGSNLSTAIGSYATHALPTLAAVVVLSYVLLRLIAARQSARP